MRLFCRISHGAVGLLALSLTGCECVKDYSLTGKLWTNGELKRFYEPANNPRLELFEDRNHGDVMAVYDEAHETRTAIRRRAYLVNGNRTRVEAGRKPRFLKADSAYGLAPLTPTGTTTASPAVPAAIQAVVSPDGKQFTLTGSLGGHTYGLPVYADRSSTFGRVLLSPFAIAGDVVIVGAVAGVVVAYAYAHGGTYYHP